MADFFAGDIKSIKINHPILGSVEMEAKSSEDNTFDLGGYRTTEVNTTGNGTSMRKINNKPWVASMLIAWDMITQQELQALGRFAGSTVEFTCTITNVNGSVYQGKGSPMGDLVGNVNQGSTPVTFSGGGELTKIA